MVSELEQKFFRVFGIEPKHKCSSPLLRIYNSDVCKGIDNCNKCAYYEYYYPEITAEKLLQLLCIVIDEYNRNGHTFYLDSTNIEELKEEILDALIGCIDASCDLFEIEVKQIQQLFKEEEWAL